VARVPRAGERRRVSVREGGGRLGVDSGNRAAGNAQRHHVHEREEEVVRNTVETGMNKSGMATAPRLAPEVLQVPGLTIKTDGDARVIAEERVSYAKKAE